METSNSILTTKHSTHSGARHGHLALVLHVLAEETSCEKALASVASESPADLTSFCRVLREQVSARLTVANDPPLRKRLTDLLDEAIAADCERGD